MKTIYKALLGVLILCLPVVSITASVNLLFRAPDLYSYEFAKGQITSEIDVQVETEDLSEFFSDFMLGKEKSFSFEAEYRDRKQELFSITEQIIMEELRRELGRLGIIGLLAFAAVAAIFYLFRRKGGKQWLRRGYRFSLILNGLCWFGLGMLIETEKGRLLGFDWISSQDFGADDLLPRMITETFIQDSFWAGLVISAIITAIIGYVTWKLTKPRRMFW